MQSKRIANLLPKYFNDTTLSLSQTRETTDYSSQEQRSQEIPTIVLVPHKVILDAPSVNGLLRRLLDLADGTLLPYPLLLLRARVCCRGGLCTLLVTVNRLPTFLADHLRTRRRLVSWLVLLRCRRCATNSAHRSRSQTGSSEPRAQRGRSLLQQRGTYRLGARACGGVATCANPSACSGLPGCISSESASHGSRATPNRKGRAS